MLLKPSFWLALALPVAVWSALLALLADPHGGQAQAVAAPTNERERFAFDLLAALGNSAPSADTVAFVVEWTLAEDSGSGALARNNPLNTTKCGFNQVGAINSDGACGVAGYATYQDGLDATVATLAQDNFAAIAYALQANDAVGAWRALIASDWAASHYGGGAEWPKVQPQASGALDPRRAQVVAAALSQVGKPYLLGTDGPDTFDCSGLVHWAYAQVGVETTRTTFTQLDALPAVDPSQIQTADMVYFQYPTDQHVGLLADLDGDGTWDMVQSGGTRNDVNVVYNVFAEPVYAQAIIGYRRAL